MVRIGVVSAHMVELGNGKVGLMLPQVAAVYTTPQAAIVADNYCAGIFRIDPDIVEISVRSTGNAAEALAAVSTEQQDQIGLEDSVFILRIDNQIAEVKRTPDHEIAGVKASPGSTAIVGAIERALLGFDVGVNDLRLRRRDGDSDASPRFCQQALGVAVVDLGPMVATISRFEKAAAWTTTAESPALAAAVPQ